MKGKGQGKYAQVNLLQKSLMEQLNPKEPLLVLARRIPWDTLCAKYYGCYAGTGRPAKPIRLMLGLLLLKQLENLSDERLICVIHRHNFNFSALFPHRKRSSTALRGKALRRIGRGQACLSMS
jgi:hypothetical protein